LASALLVGVIVSRRIIGVPLLAEAGAQQLVSILGPAIQEILPSAEAPAA